VGRAALLLLLVALSGCAKTGMPGGGPRDTEPPVVVSTVPADRSAGVDRSTDITIEFSENMNRTSVERSVTIEPQVPLGRLTWEGDVLTARPDTLLPDSTTFMVSVGDGARDHHGVDMREPFRFAFSTGYDVMAGIISGTVTFEGAPVPDAVVWACPEAVAADSLGLVSPCEYETVTNDTGAFMFRNVRTRSRRYGLVAFVDGDGDRRYDTTSEKGWIDYAGASLDTPGDSLGGIELRLFEPASEGTP
jgi:hypothetical protein